MTAAARLLEMEQGASEGVDVIRYRLGLIAWIWLAGCAHLAADEKAPDLSIASDPADQPLPVAASRPLRGMARYQLKSRPEQAEWSACLAQGSIRSVLLMHDNRSGFDLKEFCQRPEAQAFLSQKFDVVTVQRPGFGESTGEQDSWGASSLIAVEAGVTAAVKQGAKLPVGVWGYGTGAAAAVAFAKRPGQLRWLIVGGGVFDLEATEKQTVDRELRAEIAALRKASGDIAIEERSVAYDVIGLPKRFAIYHGKLDTVAPIKQAQAFGDTLQASGYEVTFQLLDGLPHIIPGYQHRKLLEVLVRSVSGVP